MVNKIEKRKVKFLRHHVGTKRVFEIVFVYLLMVGALTLIVYIEPTITGLIVISKQFNYTDNVNLVINESSEYIWELSNVGDLRSIRFSGVIEDIGYAKVFIENNNLTYLIFDSNLLEEKDIFDKVTGFVVKEEEKEENKTKPNHPPVWNSSIESFIVNESLVINLNEYFYDKDNDTLSYNFDEIADLEILLENTTLKINNKDNIVGNRTLAVYASDNEVTKKKNIILVLLNTTIINETIINKTGAPVWISDKESFIVNRSLEINLDEYFYDPEGDKLVYAVSEIFGLTIILNESIVSIENENNIVDNKTLRIVASDGWNKLSKNIVLILLNLSYLNVTEEVNMSETIENITKDIDIRLEYKTGTMYDVDDDGIETKTGVIDFTVEDTRFNFTIDESKLCTRWSTYSLESEEEIIICYGSSDCCSLVGLMPIREKWDEIFYSYYGLYGATLRNIISAQVIYADYNLSLEEPYADIYNSSWQNLTAMFYEGAILFEDVCRETCMLYDFNKSSYKLIFEINNTTLRIDSIKYTIIEKINITNIAPKLLKNFSNITINKNSQYVINLSEYFYDEDNDTLSYESYEADNITILIENNIATIIPDKDFSGVRYMYFKASDKEDSVVSNVFKITVIDTIKKMFIIIDPSDITIASIDNSGNMFLKGNIVENQRNLSPTENSFILENRTGATIAYINSSGYLFLLGNATENADMSKIIGYNLEIQNEENKTIAFFDDTGNFKLKGILVEGYES